MSTDQRLDVLALIDGERDKQDATWGEQNHPDADPVILGWLERGNDYASPSYVASRLAQEYEVPSASRARALCQIAAQQGRTTWTGILLEEFCEAVDAIPRGSQVLRGELVQVAAVAVAWIEAIDRRDGGSQ